MIYIYPVGGLGNMFFHIASIWSLAKDNDDELCLLNIDAKIKELDAAINIVTTWTHHADKYRYILNRFLIKDFYNSHKIEYPYHYIPLDYKNEYQYIGYFQSEKYFKHRRNEILELFKPDDSFLPEIEKYDLSGNIGMHVRRAWIPRYHHIHTVQPLEYFNNAISMLPEDLKIVIFSDDLEWSKANFVGDRFVFIDEIDKVAMYLIGKMKHNIISNSTFGWWGAWMGEPETVIAPKQWFGTDIPTGDLIPENWIRI